MPDQQYSSRCVHTDTFYLNQIEGLLAGLNAGMSDRAITADMNERGLFSASGSAWTVAAVVQALHKLRYSRIKGSNLYSALLRLHWDGLLTKAQCLPLFEPRNQPAVRM